MATLTTLTIRATPITGLDDILAAVVAASELKLPEGALERLKLLCNGLGDRIVCDDLRHTPGAGVFDLPLRLDLPPADVVFLAALRARDICAIAQTVSAGGVGVTADPAQGST